MSDQDLSDNSENRDSEFSSWFVDHSDTGDRPLLERIRPFYTDPKGLTITPEQLGSVVARLMVDPVAQDEFGGRTMAEAWVEFQRYEEDGLDSLTRVKNREGFNRWLRSAVGVGADPQRRAYDEKTLGIFFLDFTNFKEINDKINHEVGDAVLRVGFQELSNLLREGDKAIVAHFGGDEGRIATADLSYEDAQAIYRRIHTFQFNKLARHAAAIRRFKETVRRDDEDQIISDVEIHEVIDDKFGPGLEQALMTVLVDGQPIAPVSDLAVIAVGFAFAKGEVITGEMCKRATNESEERMKALKKVYHKQLGGAYR